MDEQELQNRIAIGTVILELILKYGPALATKMMATMVKDNDSLEDWLALRNRVPHPDFYEGA